MDPDPMELLARAHLTWKRRVARDLAPHGLNPKQIFVLRTLASGSASPSQIAELIFGDRPSATSLLNTLERAGWIARKPDRHNRRHVAVTLTAAGRAKLASVPESLWRTGKTAVDPLARLSMEERRHLTRLVDLVIASVEEPERAAAVADEVAAADTDRALTRAAEAQYRTGDAGFPIVAGRTALLMIDMQEEFVTPRGGPYRVPAAAARVPAMRRLLDAFRAHGWPIVHTAFARTHGFRDRPRLGSLMPNRGPADAVDDGLFEQARFVPALAPRADEIVIAKPSYGAFYDTPLETILRGAGVDTVVLAGTLTDCCVGTTARQAFERGFGAVVASDATATSLEAMHEAELCILRRAFARVLTADAIITALEVTTPTRRAGRRPQASRRTRGRVRT